jgi:hypothetical protein
LPGGAKVTRVNRANGEMVTPQMILEAIEGIKWNMARQEQTAYEVSAATKKFPNVWCSGCGIGIVMGA